MTPKEQAHIVAARMREAGHPAVVFIYETTDANGLPTQKRFAATSHADAICRMRHWNKNHANTSRLKK